MGGEGEGRGGKAGSGGERGSKTPSWKGEDEDRYVQEGRGECVRRYVGRWI